MTDRFKSPIFISFLYICSFSYYIYKIEFDNMTVIELTTLAKEHGLKSYSKLRKAELITLLQNNLHPPQPTAANSPNPTRQLQTCDPRPSATPSPMNDS